jgi:hypothetical protein
VEPEHSRLVGEVRSQRSRRLRLSWWLLLLAVRERVSPDATVMRRARRHAADPLLSALTPREAVDHARAIVFQRTLRPPWWRSVAARRNRRWRSHWDR